MSGSHWLDGDTLVNQRGEIIYQRQTASAIGAPAGSTTQVQFNDAGSFAGSSGLTYNKSTHVLAVSGGFTGNLTGNVTGNITGNVTGNADSATLATLAAGSKETVTVRATDTSAPITQKKATVLLTKGSAGAWTLAAPTAGDDDGSVLTIIAGTAFAHTVTTPLNIVNGGKHLVTYAAVGDSVVLEAYNGVWLTRGVGGAVVS